jgi:toxin FitB
MGFLLGTNILSELRKERRANPNVRQWYAAVEDSDIFTSVLVVGEIRHGIELKRRKDAQFAVSLENWLMRIESEFSDRILPVTIEIANLWGKLCLDKPLSEPDGLIAASALYHDLVLITRNVKDVHHTGVRVVNPFLS